MQLQKSATGLLGWLQLKIGGRNPTAFSDTLVGTIDLTDLYQLQGEVGVETAVGSNFAIGTSASPQMIATVPAGKIWRVFSVGSDLALAAADNAFDTAVQYTFALAGSSGFVAHVSTNGAKSPGNGRYGAYYLPRPFFLSAGQSVVFSQYSSANLTVAALQHYYVLRQLIDI